MTQQPPTTSPGRPGDSLDRFFDRVRATGIRRRLSDRWLAGVCGGVADKIGVDPLVVRIALALLVGTGLGIAAYFVAFSLLADTHDEIPLEKAIRQGDGQSVMLLVVTGLMVINVFQGGPTWHLGGTQVHGGGWVVVAAVLGIIALARRGRRARPGRTADALGWVPPADGAPGPARSADPATGPETATAQTDATRPLVAGHAPAGATSPALSWPAQEAVPAAGAATPPGAGTAYLPRRRRRPSLGWPGALAALGLAVAGAASVIAAQQSGRLHLHHVYLVADAVALALVAAFLVVIGLAGRRGGAATGITIALTSLALTGGPVILGDHADRPWLTSPDGHSVGMGTRTWTPTDLQGRETYQVGAGEGTLDLTRLSRSAAQGRTVATQVGMGDLVVKLPQGLTTRVHSQVGMGDLTVKHADGSTEKVDGDAVIGTGDPVLMIDAEVGMGDMTIEEVAR